MTGRSDGDLMIVRLSRVYCGTSAGPVPVPAASLSRAQID